MPVKHTTVILLLLALGLFAPGALSGADGGRIAVLVSSNEAPFKEAVSGFEAYLAKQGYTSGYDVFRLDGDAAKAGPAVQRIKASGSHLVFTVGTVATDAALKGITDIPIVACLVLRTDGLRKAPNATGVGLEFPLDTQLAWMQKFLPRSSTIGVIYSAGENQQKVEAAAEAARTAGLRLEAKQVRSPQDVPAALNNLSKQADALWSIPDSVMLSPTIAKNVLLFSFRNSIPVVGPSTAWVKAGALYALDWDYADLGGQCGEQADRILKGVAPSSVPVATPRTARYTINLVTARQMKLELPEQLVKGAHQTY